MRDPPLTHPGRRMGGCPVPASQFLPLNPGDPMEPHMTTVTRQVTHEVLNQVPPLAGHDVADDPALLAALDREGAAWAASGLHELGALAGAAAPPGAAGAGGAGAPAPCR